MGLGGPLGAGSCLEGAPAVREDGETLMGRLRASVWERARAPGVSLQTGHSVLAWGCCWGCGAGADQGEVLKLGF